MPHTAKPLGWREQGEGEYGMERVSSSSPRPFWGAGRGIEKPSGAERSGCGSCQEPHFMHFMNESRVLILSRVMLLPDLILALIPFK